MSVLKFSKEEIAQIASTIKEDARLNQKFLSLKEIGELALLGAYPPTEEKLRHKINCFCERLYIANALAYQYGYGEKISVERLEEKDLEGSLIQMKALSEKLRSLRYNIFTNSGHSFLSEDDAKKLDRLIQMIRDNLDMHLAGWE